MYTKKDIKEQLQKMNAPRNSVVLMHSSLRTVGQVEGGGQGLLDALVEYFTEDGGLFCVPTHTWRNLGKDKVTLDMTVAESHVGAFSVIAAEDPRSVRSENATHSMVVFGDRSRAEEFVKGEIDIKSPTAPNSCYGKIYDAHGYILLVGVGQNRNTYLHCVGEMLSLPCRMSDSTRHVTIRRLSGEMVERDLQWYDQVTLGDISVRFPKYDVAFRYRGCVTDGFIGDAPTQLCDAVGMKETVELIFRNGNGADPLADERPIPPIRYVR